MNTTTTHRNGSTRIAGIVGLVGGLLGAAFAVYELATLPYEVSILTNTRFALAELMVIVTLVGLAALGAAGSAWWGRVGIAGAILGFVLLITAELTEPSDAATAETIFMIAPLVLGLGMLLAGLAVLRAHMWAGWRRFAPLAVGVYIFVVFLPVSIAFSTATGIFSVLLGWHLVLAALGLAVLVEATAPINSRDRSRVA